MQILRSMQAAASALTANRLMADATTNNIANMRTTRTEEGGPYQRQAVVMSARPFALPDRQQTGTAPGVDARLTTIPGEDKLEYDPTHPDADANGYVHYPDINLAEEMVNLIVAQRSYEANVTAFNTIKQMAQRTLDLGK